MDGKWKVGECITSENALCKELSVSRVSVRSALQQFIALGILESVHGKGTYLVSNDVSAFEAPEESSNKLAGKQELFQILEYRSLIEPEICGKVAASPCPELIAKLESLLATMQDSVGKSQKFIDSDVQFHLEICAAYNNPIISNALSNVLTKKADKDNLVSLGNGYYGGIYYHGKILDAIKAHDEKRASSTMREHLRHGMEEVLSDMAEISGPA